MQFRQLSRIALIALAVTTVSVGSAAVAGAISRNHHPKHRRIWVPAPHTTWQLQLSTPVDQSVSAQVFDIDLFDNSASVVASLHRHARRVICYLDAGTYENYRSDAGRFPAAVLGQPNSWLGERWLDIRRLSVLAPIMRARFELCKRKHFDGVDVDNIDGYENGTGFAISGSQQLAYNRWLARTAHSLGLSIALKNDVDQAAQLQPYFDYALDEQCFEYSECSKLRPFVAAHKAVFEVEYNLSLGQFCAQAHTDGFMSMRKHLNLDASRQVCW